ncbi:hypothetical protein QZK55_05365 [Acinetobacter baumannii]|nr:hypothetical protein [Acinetobacter baumannii]
MISEITFAKDYTSFWNNLLTNGKNYVRLVNGTLITDTHKPFIKDSNATNLVAFVNLVSFKLFQKSLKSNDCLSQLEIDHICVDAANQLKVFSSFYKNFIIPDFNVIKEEVDFITNHLNIRYSEKDIKISPFFPGLGFLNNSEADLLFDKTLVELKSGERKFKLIDFRQILIYLTQNHFSKEPIELEYIELFNPRMGIVLEERIDEMIYQLSALTPVEVYEEIQYFLCNNHLING